MKKLLAWVCFITILIFTPGAQSVFPVESARASANGAEVITAINSYRSQNGLPSYISNSSLMAIAQAQSDYQASIASITHTGPGGTRPIDRAYAIGYGGGNTIFVSEIIYGGTSASVDNAMNWWKNSSIHNESMLSPFSVEIGAGVASSGGRLYFTAVMGTVSGSAPPADPSPGESSTSEVETPPAGNSTSAPLIIPVQANTPLPDGSIVHIVQPGQALWNVAAIYEVSIEDLLSINELSSNSFLQPDQELLVRAAQTPEVVETTPSPTSSPPSPTATTRVSQTADPDPTRTHQPTQPTLEATPETEETDSIRRPGSQSLMGVGALFLLIGIAGFLRSKIKSKENSSQSES
jgi:LysM repeat protein